MTIYLLAWWLALWLLWLFNPGLSGAIGFWGWALGCFAYVLYRNHALHTPGVLVLSGMALNALVMLANGGYMPAPVSGAHHTTDGEALGFLGDVIPVVQASVGDALIAAGIVLLAAQTVRVKVTG